MPATRPRLNGMADIRAFFRTNETPIHFVSPTAFNLLGLDRWVRNFFYVNYYDSFQGHHPRVFVPRERPPREFQSIEEICNYCWVTRRWSTSSTRRAAAARPLW
jgi:hypothetical protein